MPRQPGFTELRDALGATQGNLPVQLRKLEAAGYVAIDKNFVDRKPLTTARLTAAGRTAFAEYLTALSDVVGTALR